ncbi:hypothetical protein AMTRI_Chr06g192080 [Amborella trichopoda]
MVFVHLFLSFMVVSISLSSFSLLFTGMYKNQLQELAQRSCFNLPSYACIREGPDHAPRFKASVNFNGEIFECPNYCTTLRQAEHAAAEVALNTLSTRGPSRSLAARVLDETGVYKNLLQETAHRAGLNLPLYTTVRSGPGHLPVFTCNVELAGLTFNGDSAKTKKQAEKNAAMAAWTALKQLPHMGSSQTNRDPDSNEEQEQVIVARALASLRPKDESAKPVRQSQHQQGIPRRRVIMGYNNNPSNGHSLSTHSNAMQQYQQWRSPDRVPDIVIYQKPQQTQSRFLALPAPPPPQTSKILPLGTIFKPSTTQEQSSPRVSNVPPICANDPHAFVSKRVMPVQIRTRPQVKIQEVQPPLEEHQKDEDEWLGVKSEVTIKPNETEPINNGNNSNGPTPVFRPRSGYSRPFSLQNTVIFNAPHPEHKNHPTQSGSKIFRPQAASLPQLMVPVVRGGCNVNPRILRADNFNGGIRAHAVAPAVQIRSVVPVCASPPLRPSSNPVEKKEEGPKKLEETTISRASSSLSKLQL